MARSGSSPASLAALVIDRSSPIPLYYQISQHVEKEIESGNVPPGTLLDNEIEWADRLGISRPTMRRALDELVTKGLIVRRRGSGTRVVQPKVRRKLELTSLYDDLLASGRTPTTTVLEMTEREADAEIAERLGCVEGDPVFWIARLRSANGLPIARLTNYLPASVVRFGREDLSTHGLYSLLRRAGVRLHTAHQTVGARRATPAEARLLEEPRNAPLLTMERTAYDDAGAVVELGSHLYAASRYTFEITLAYR